MDYIIGKEFCGVTFKMPDFNIILGVSVLPTPQNLEFFVFFLFVLHMCVWSTWPRTEPLADK